MFFTIPCFVFLSRTPEDFEASILGVVKSTFRQRRFPSLKTSEVGTRILAFVFWPSRRAAYASRAGIWCSLASFALQRWPGGLPFFLLLWVYWFGGWIHASQGDRRRRGSQTPWSHLGPLPIPQSICGIRCMPQTPRWCVFSSTILVIVRTRIASNTLLRSWGRQRFHQWSVPSWHI